MSSNVKVDKVAWVGAEMPKRTAFAEKPVEERMAAYANSIRKMLIYFTIISVFSIVFGVVVGIVGVVELGHAEQPSDGTSLTTGY